MGEEKLIALEQFCAYYNVEASFIRTLSENGLIDVIKIDDADFVEIEQLSQLEKFVRFYYELDINLAGIETINYLLLRLKNMQDEVISLRNKLRFYESDSM